MSMSDVPLIAPAVIAVTGSILALVFAHRAEARMRRVTEKVAREGTE